MLMLAVSAAALGLVAWWLYRYEREEAWKSAAEELVIIARAKVAQLEAWREERKNDAAFLSRAGFVAKRSSLASSGVPRTAANAANCRSLPTAITNRRSAAAKTS